MQQWNFNVQRELFRKEFVLTTAYVGSKGTHLQIPEEINGAPYASRRDLGKHQPAAALSAFCRYRDAGSKRQFHVSRAAD